MILRTAFTSFALAASLSAQGAMLGVQIDSTAEDYGAAIQEVLPRSAAQVAGLRPGDVILELDGAPIAGGPALVEAVRGRLPGEVIDLLLERDGERLELMAVLGRSARAPLLPRPAMPGFPDMPALDTWFEPHGLPGPGVFPRFDWPAFDVPQVLELNLPYAPGARKEVRIRYPESTPQDERQRLIEDARERYGADVDVGFEGEGTRIRIQSYLEGGLNEAWTDPPRKRKERTDA